MCNEEPRSKTSTYCVKCVRTRRLMKIISTDNPAKSVRGSKPKTVPNYDGPCRRCQVEDSFKRSRYCKSCQRMMEVIRLISTKTPAIQMCSRCKEAPRRVSQKHCNACIRITEVVRITRTDRPAVLPAPKVPRVLKNPLLDLPCATCGVAERVEGSYCSPCLDIHKAHRAELRAANPGMSIREIRLEELKDACRNGHPWTEQSTILRPTGSKGCRICAVQSSRRHAATLNYPVSVSEQQCASCSRTLPASAFTTQKTRKTGLNRECRTCVSQKGQERRFGVPSGTYARQLADQDGCCAICGVTEELYRQACGRRFAFDHDHDCCDGCVDCVRGLLCTLCNTALGGFKDDPSILERAAVYLRTWSDRRAAALAARNTKVLVAA